MLLHLAPRGLPLHIPICATHLLEPHVLGKLPVKLQFCATKCPRTAQARDTALPQPAAEPECRGSRAFPEQQRGLLPWFQLRLRGTPSLSGLVVRGSDRSVSTVVRMSAWQWVCVCQCHAYLIFREFLYFWLSLLWHQPKRGKYFFSSCSCSLWHAGGRTTTVKKHTVQSQITALFGLGASAFL